MLPSPHRAGYIVASVCPFGACCLFFFFNDTATTEIYTLSLHDALPIYMLEKRGRRLNVVGATSGDTGSSAEYALRGKKNIKVFMLSPQGRMSAFQAAQMYSLQDANIFNIAVRGVFDDCQDIVKAISGDFAFKPRHRIVVVNSINWARVAAQVVYYFKAYFAVGGEVSFAVPSGNFGNVYARHVAREMGLAIRKRNVATNENDAPDEVLRTGRHRVRKAAEVKATR